MAGFLKPGFWLLVLHGALTACGDTPDPMSEPLATSDAGTQEHDAGPTVPRDCHDLSTGHDVDHDGFSSKGGDCDDCDPLVNPGALDQAGNDVDEDCSGADAADAGVADQDLEPESQDPEDAARALGLGAFPGFRSRAWGVTGARWLRLDGSEQLESPLQVWMPEHFGSVKAREGKRLWVMSTGVARDFDADDPDPDYTPLCDWFDAGPPPWTHSAMPPEGYPRDSSQCSGGVGSFGAQAYNDVGLELELRVPTNARSLSFDSIFFTYEYPDFVCSRFNDFYLVKVDPAPLGLDDGNVVFDSNGDTVGVNTGLLSVCRASERSMKEIACEQGPALLAGTGFDMGESTCASDVSKMDDIGGAATGWLRTTVPVQPGSELTLHFMLWDSGDPLLDSTVVVDNLQFHLESVNGAHTGPITSGL